MYGLTKREYIAAALSGMLACFPGTLGTFKEAAECAVMYADALLAALEGKHE
jgi:predicted Rossmann-fold nucleotide-binding protein